MIEMNKKYQTRDGKSVRVLCVDGPRPQPVIGIVAGEDYVDTWYTNGKYDDDPVYHSKRDLIPKPEKHEGWAILRDGSPYVDSRIYSSREEAEAVANAADKVRYKDETHSVAHVEWEA